MRGGIKSRRKIPTVDIPDGPGPFAHELVQTVGTALENIGFVFVRAPEISGIILPAVYPEFQRFFGLPLAVKLKYARPETRYNVGYTPLLQEEALFCKRAGPDGGPIGDYKETYMMGREVPPDHEYLQSGNLWNQANIWPAEAPDFRWAMGTLYGSLYPIGQKVLRVLAQFLELPLDHFDKMIHNGPTVMRAIHYPPFTMEQIGRIVWGCAHTDINLITILPAATKPVSEEDGLWIRLRRSTEFIQGRPPSEGYVLAQTGDMLKLFTDGRIASALHEVRAPKKAITNGRFSAAMFMHPRSETILKGEKTAGLVLDKRLQALGLGPGVAKAGY